MNNTIVKIIGWTPLILDGDPSVYDRLKWLEEHLDEGSLRTLDAGCGTGVFAMYAAKMGNRAVGMSFDNQEIEEACDKAEILDLSDVRFIKADLRKLDGHKKRLGKFDQIICFETIEHIRDDEKLISDLSDILKPGGKLLLTTPYKDYNLLFGEEVSRDEDGGHVRLGYTHKRIRELFNRNNLNVVTEDYISGFISQQLNNLIRILSEIDTGIALVITLPLRIFQIFDTPLSKIINYPYLSIGVVGVKEED